MALINGKPLGGATDIVRLQFKNGWVCSGLFLDAYTILTAAHCIYADGINNFPRLEKVFSADDKLINVTVVSLLPHPSYAAQAWPSSDVGLIKTTKNDEFTGSLRLETKVMRTLGRAELFGCGRTDPVRKEYARTTGENNFLRLGSVLFFFGKSAAETEQLGVAVIIAPNDSGGPIVDISTGNVVAIATTTTAKQSSEHRIPALSTGTSTVIAENLDFILAHLGP